MALKIMLFGKDGQLGSHLAPVLERYGELDAFGRAEADFNEPDHLAGLVEEKNPDIVVNAAAYTDVDGAETDRDIAFRVNGTAVGVLAQAARAQRASLIHFSTDYVFDGRKGQLYKEEDAARPVNIYGESKLAGERAAAEAGGAFVILRTSWVYAREFDNFATRVQNWLREKEQLRIVEDQVGSPSWSGMLAATTGLIVGKGGDDPYSFLVERAGTYHLAGEGAVSRYGWARAIQSLSPSDATRIEPASSDEFPALAQRPAYSALDCAKIKQVFGLTLDAWDSYLPGALA